MLGHAWLGVFLASGSLALEGGKEEGKEGQRGGIKEGRIKERNEGGREEGKEGRTRGRKEGRKRGNMARRKTGRTEKEQEVSRLLCLDGLNV